MAAPAGPKWVAFPGGLPTVADDRNGIRAVRFTPVIPWTLGAIILVMSVVSFATMALDKRAARRNRPRVPERTLHVMELLGGWPGSFAAQQLFRHKTRKWSYQFVYWLIVTCWVAGLATWWWTTR